MSRDDATDGRARPDWRRPALRVGLEIAFVALVATYLSIHIASPLAVALLVVTAIVGSVAQFFRTLDRQAYAWVRYASKRAQQSQRNKKREREQRRKQQRQARQRQQRADGDSDG